MTLEFDDVFSSERGRGLEIEHDGFIEMFTKRRVVKLPQQRLAPRHGVWERCQPAGNLQGIETCDTNDGDASGRGACRQCDERIGRGFERLHGKGHFREKCGDMIQTF